MSDPAKVEKLFGVLTLAFLISYGWGCEMKRNTTLTTPRKRKSIFRLGLDRIARLLAHGEDFDEEIRALLEWFERPKHHSIFVV